jgi:hypothetical protein
MKIFITSFTQVFLIAINTYLISQTLILGVMISTFLINLVWTYNVRKMSIGNFKERLLYSFGASIGALFGLLFIKLII